MNDFITEEAFESMLEAWFQNMARVLAPGRAFYIWGGYSNCANYPPVLERTGLYFAQAIIWVKEHPVLTRKDFMGNHEWCFYGWREGTGHSFFGAKNIPDVWEITTGEGRKPVPIGKGLRIKAGDSAIDLVRAGKSKLKAVELTKTGLLVTAGELPTDVWRIKKVNPQSMVHLTEKPIELAARAMYYSTRPKENVLDLFGGSGSTLMACQEMNRRGFLMELDPLYCDVILNRWASATGQNPVRVSDKYHFKIPTPEPALAEA
jgi:DNA modification methylase